LHISKYFLAALQCFAARVADRLTAEPSDEVLEAMANAMHEHANCAWPSVSDTQHLFAIASARAAYRAAQLFRPVEAKSQPVDYMLLRQQLEAAERSQKATQDLCSVQAATIAQLHRETAAQTKAPESKYSEEEEQIEAMAKAVTQFMPIADAMKAARAASFGTLNWSDDYITFNGYGNLESISDIESYIEMDEIIADILENPNNYSL